MKGCLTTDTEGMNRTVHPCDTTARFTRRQVLAMGTAGLISLICAPLPLPAAPLKNDLAMVARIAGMTERETPLLIFRDVVDDPDAEIEKQSRGQVRRRKDILACIGKKFGTGRRVRLSVEQIEVRLMFVPQQQKRSAAAYRRYCRDIVDYLFEINRTDNFYTAIDAPSESYPPIPNAGISAFLVHRLAKAYRAVCRFEADSGRSVKYRVTGAIFSNHLGAVDLEIECVSPGRFSLHRRPFTIWQNSSDAVYTLLSIPVEETLHYYLGNATDRQIADTLRANPMMDLSSARSLAEEWMAVEESVVGGLVDQVLERYCATYGLPRLHQFTNGGNAPPPALSQYRYRRQGLALVRDLGLRRSIAMYMARPSDFKARLDLSQGA